MLKNKIKLVLRALRGPWVTHQRLKKDLCFLGVQKGDVLMVHSSMSSLGFVLGKEKAVINALLGILGPDGTLIMPAHTWEAVNAGSRFFDARLSPSCVGQLSDSFRKMSNVSRSLHPTHSIAAIGPKATWLVEGHEDTLTPCGKGSPYDKLLQLGGRILMLGVGLESNTTFHTIEDLASFPYLVEPKSIAFGIRDMKGKIMQKSVFLHLEGVKRCYPTMEIPLVKRGALNKGRIGLANSLLIEGTPFLKTVSSLLLENQFLLMENPTQKIPAPRSS